MRNALPELVPIGSRIASVAAALGLALATACAPPTTPTAPPAAPASKPTEAPKPAAPAASPAASPAAASPVASPAAAASPAASPAAAAKPAGGEPIKIGLNFAMTIAGASPIAPMVKEGADLHAEAINAAGGVLGRQIQLITYDNENSQEKAVQLARKMIEEDKVLAIAADRTATNLVISPIAE